MLKLSCHCILYLLCLLSFNACHSQSNVIIEVEAQLSDDFDKDIPIYYKMPEFVNSTDTSIAWFSDKKRIILTGTIFERDGKTPAPNILMYYYQTNSEGKYVHNPKVAKSMPKNSLGQTHGAIRGWVRSDSQGEYKIYTALPGYYPKNPEPAHIHPTIVDPKMKEPYYFDNFVFDNDPLLKTAVRQGFENRGGSGIIRFVKNEGQLIGERDIILGLNIPDYPVQIDRSVVSGKEAGEELFSFMPFHAWGKDAGSKACPICKYGWFQGVLYFVGKESNWQEVKEWLVFLDAESKKNEEFLNVHLVVGNYENMGQDELITKLKEVGREINLKHTALTFVPSFEDKESEIYLNKINPEVASTIIIYQRSRIIDKYINMTANRENFDKVRNRLEQSKSEFLKLARADKLE